MATFVNDLRLTELATGEGSGSWGTTTNLNLELIGEAFSFGTEAITTNADTHTTTIADGSTDPGRSLFLKYTGTLDSNCTITIGPNTVSKLWFIENATSGGFSIIISQGSGANITIPNGQTKAIYSDGAGSGAAMVDAFQDLSIPDLFVDDDLTVGDDLILSSDGAIVKFGADADTTLTHTDGTGLTLNSTNKLTFGDAASFVQQSSDGVLRIDGEATIDLNASTAVTVSNDLKLDSDSAVLGFGADNDTTLTHTDGSGLTLNSTNKIMFNDASQFIQGSSATVLSLGATDEIDLTATAIDVNGTMDVSGALTGTTATFTTADNTAQVALVSTDADASDGPILEMFRNSSSPADDDDLGIIKFFGENDASEKIEYGIIEVKAVDVSDGTEDGSINITAMLNGTARSRLFSNSTETVLNEGSQDLDFRVESDGNSHMLFIDAGNDRVMVGKSSTGLANQGVEFEDGQIKGTATGQTVAFLNRASDDGTILDIRKDNSVVGTIGSNSAGGTPTFDFSSNSSSGIIRFLTSGSERARIDQAGDVGIGTSTLNKFFNLADPNEGGETLKLHFEASSSADKWAIFSFDRTNSHYAGLSFGANSLVIEGGGNIIANENSADADFRIESDSNTHAFFVNGEFKSVIGMATSSPVSYANGDTVLYLHGAHNPAIALSDNGQTRDYFITAQGSSLNINYADGSNTSSASNVTTLASFDNSGETTLTRADNGVNLTLQCTDTDANAGPNLKLERSATGADNDLLGTIVFLGLDDAGVGEDFARIFTSIDDASHGSVDGRITIATQVAGTERERIRMTSTETVFNEDSVNLDFRVESDTNANLLFVDAEADGGQVIIGSSTPITGVNSLLSVNGLAHTRIAIDGTDSSGIYLLDSGAEGITIRNAGGALEFYPVAAHEVVFNEGSVDANFRVETNDIAFGLFVDAGSNYVLIGNSTATTGQDFLRLDANPGGSGHIIITGRDDTSTKNHIVFTNPNGTVGSIQTAGSSTAFNTSSDARLKENIADAEDAGELVDAIQVRQFDWKADGGHQRYGMVAQELNDVAPEAVFEGDTEEDMMGVDYSKLVPMLVKEIQSLRKRIAKLEGE